MSVYVLQLEHQRQQLLTERQTFHTEQLQQAEMKVRQQREQQAQPGYPIQQSGLNQTHTTIKWMMTTGFHTYSHFKDHTALHYVIAI